MSNLLKITLSICFIFYILHVFSIEILHVAVIVNIASFIMFFSSKNVSIDFIQNYLISDIENYNKYLSSGDNLAWVSFIPICIFVFFRIYEMFIYSESLDYSVLHKTHRTKITY